MKPAILKLSVAIVFFVLTVTSCNNENIPAVSDKIYSNEQLELNRQAFAKTLAIAMADISVRELIKLEAAKQFDGEMEVLFQTVKDRKLSSGVSLIDKLKTIYGSKVEFEEITKSLPLLTILVPKVYKFSNEEWNLQTQIPAVATLSNKYDQREISTLKTFYSTGESKELKRLVIPSEPVLVVKDSERIELSNTANARASASSGKSFNTGYFTFRFKDKSFENNGGIEDDNENNRIHFPFLNTADNFDPRAYYAYDQNLQYHRDYVYYGIAPELGVNIGAFNSNYAEYITHMEFEQPYNLSGVYDDNYTDWSDGTFEFLITILYIENKTSLGNTQKLISVPLNKLCDCTYNTNGSITINGLMNHNFPGKGHEIVPWDMQKYGDTWKFSVVEQDATTSTAINFTTSINSSYGTNYSSGQKDGPNFGSTSTNGVQYGQSYTYTVAGGSDILGDAMLSWRDKIIIDKPLPDMDLMSRSHTISTGTLILSVEPRYRY